MHGGDVTEWVANNYRADQGHTKGGAAVWARGHQRLSVCAAAISPSSSRFPPWRPHSRAVELQRAEVCKGVAGARIAIIHALARGGA